MTHHKTGTILMGNIFGDYARLKRFKFGSITKEVYLSKDILIGRNSELEHVKKLGSDFKGIHVIRHPFEVISSGYRYHKICDESWCIKPQKKYSGKSYQEVIKSLPQDEGILMEMEERSKKVILDMYNWDYEDSRYLNVKLEDFRDDFDKTIKKIAKFLNLSEEELLSVAKKHDIYSNEDLRIREKHVTNKSSNKYTHKDLWTEEHYKRFSEIFPEDLLKKLGYEN